MQLSEVPGGFGLIILSSFYLSVFDSSANRSLAPLWVFKCSHLRRICLGICFFGCPSLTQHDFYCASGLQGSYTARESQGNYVDNARQKRIVNWQNACLEKCKNNGQRFVDFLAVKNISSDVSSTSITTATLMVKAERCFGYVQSNEGGLCECGSCSISKHQKLVLTQPLGKKGIHVLPLYSRSSLDVTVTLANETQQELFASFGFKPPNNMFPL